MATVWLCDGGGWRLRELRGAAGLSLEERQNDLWKAELRLPAGDPAAAELGVHRLVRIDLEGESVLLRVCGEGPSDLLEERMRVFQLEHVLAFLLDERIGGYMETGTQETPEVLEELLSLQAARRWAAGRCELSARFQYAWECESLLEAVLSLFSCFPEGGLLDWDTDGFPWRLHLLRRPERAACRIRSGRNLRGLQRCVDMSRLCTRLYCLGSGEGVNQTGIREVNPTGLPFLDSPNQDKYGILSRHLIDRSVSDGALLLARGQALLREMEEPREIWRVSALDVSAATGWELDRPRAGRRVRVEAPEAGAEFEGELTRVLREDLLERPMEVQLELGEEDSLTTAVEELAARGAVAQRYAQGATNLFPMQVADNADSAHPARLRFYIPEDCVHINRVLLTWELQPFRAYARGAEAGGGTSTTTLSGGGAAVTSADGGGSTRTSSGASSCSGTTRARTVSEQIGTGAPLVGGEVSGMTGQAISLSGTGAVTRTGGSGTLSTGNVQTSGGGTQTGSAGGHSHGISVNSHSHSFSGSDSLSIGHTHYVSGVERNTGGMSTNYSKTVSISGTTGSSSPGGSTDEEGSHSHSMGHWHNLDGHSHTMGHRHEFTHSHLVNVAVNIPELEVTLQDHTHTLEVPTHSHSVQVPSHAHSLTLADHRHEIVYGIYEGGTAREVAVEVDGTRLPEGALRDAGGRPLSEVEISGYLSMTGGRIRRGCWHEVTLRPDSLTRIQADLFIQTFVTSYTGGRY